MRLPTPPSCLCGCGGSLNPCRRFQQGHDQRTYGCLVRLDRGERRLGDEDVLEPALLDFYRQDPNFHVVRREANAWDAQRILELARRLRRD